MGNVSGSVIQVDESRIRGHVDEVVRSSVEATLNGLLDAEADQLCRAERYERTPDRVDTRAGSYERKLQTKAHRGDAQGPAAAELAVRDADRRALPTARVVGGGALMELYLAGVGSCEGSTSGRAPL
ncbi:Transposase, Mutator family [Lacipirellula limnantheis]|uniref:Transposase, Mutator family n=1 Tax=Lacipirellula limnantheis TaxID=2528024 RepID=A0A517TYF3_9BACT|nr:Transposase, Mutator family [Lacipirellula limnantheis]